MRARFRLRFARVIDFGEMTRRRSPATLAVLAGWLAIYLIAPFGAGLTQARVADWGSARSGRH